MLSRLKSKNTKMKVLGIIPARYASTRFPGKPLADMKGKPMIARVYEAVEKCFDKVVVAADDRRVYDAVAAFGGNVVMTSTEHNSGTDRCYEAFRLMSEPFDVVVNVQGDEPFIDPAQIELLKSCFADPATDIATLVVPFRKEGGMEDVENPNSPKVVLDADGRALYFSRSVVPFVRGVEREKWIEKQTFYKHIGLYAYRSRILEQITKLPQSPLELAESLEQLRWLENGLRIQTAVTDIETIGIDTPADLEKALTAMGE